MPILENNSVHFWKCCPFWGTTFLLFIMVNPQRYVTHTFRVKLFPLPGLLSFVVLQVKKEHFVSCIIPIQTTEDISRFHPS